MSYCVNCGVELDKTCSVCPLCNTPVINPNESVDTTSLKPFSENKGVSDPVRRTDVTIFATVVLAATAIVCAVLNIFSFKDSSWSFYVIGICFILWVLLIPMFFPNKLNKLLCISLDSLSILIYVGIISYLHPGNGWFIKIALPLIIIVNAMVVLFVYILKHPKHSILSMAALFTAEVSILTAVIELLIDNYTGNPLHLTWGAITLVCGIVIDTALITILRQSRLREEIRRRMHI